MQIRTIRAGDGMLLKEATLRSVEEAPYAFGGPGTLAEERSRPDSQWHQLAADCAGDVAEWRDRCVGYFIADGDTICAKAISYLCDRTPRRAYVSGAWVAPRYRRQGLGRQLVRAACDWAAGKGADHLKLWVDETNPAGAAFYRSLGFRSTGESRPVSATSAVRENGFEIALPGA